VAEWRKKGANFRGKKRSCFSQASNYVSKVYTQQHNRYSNRGVTINCNSLPITTTGLYFLLLQNKFTYSLSVSERCNIILPSHLCQGPQVVLFIKAFLQNSTWSYYFFHATCTAHQIPPHLISHIWTLVLKYWRLLLSDYLLTISLQILNFYCFALLYQ